MSTPHIILFRNESKNDLLCGTAKRIVRSALLMTKVAPSVTLKVRLSMDIDASLFRVEILNSKRLESGITIGRIVRL